MERTWTALRPYVPALGIVVLQVFLWPMSAGMAVSGAIMGGLGAMIALGMAVIFRANNTVSFAQAELGALPATMAIVVMEVWGFTYWMSLVGGLFVALVVGTVVEFLFVRRFFAAPPLLGTVATIGVAQLLLFASVSFPMIWNLAPKIRTYDAPFDVRWQLGAVVFDANDLIAAVVAPTVMVALWAMLRFTNTGVALRASAANHQRASMLGIAVLRLQTEVWAGAAAMSFLAVFLQAGITGLPPGGVMSWTILLRALAAMVLGNMVNLGAIAASSIALGILQTGMERSGDGAWVGPVLLAVVVADPVAVEMPSMAISPPILSSTGSAYARVVVAIVASLMAPLTAALKRPENPADAAVAVLVTLAVSVAVMIRLPVVVVSFAELA